MPSYSPSPHSPNNNPKKSLSDLGPHRFGEVLALFVRRWRDKNAQEFKEQTLPLLSLEELTSLARAISSHEIPAGFAAKADRVQNLLTIANWYGCLDAPDRHTLMAIFERVYPISTNESDRARNDNRRLSLHDLTWHDLRIKVHLELTNELTLQLEMIERGELQSDRFELAIKHALLFETVRKLFTYFNSRIEEKAPKHDLCQPYLALIRRSMDALLPRLEKLNIPWAREESIRWNEALAAWSKGKVFDAYRNSPSASSVLEAFRKSSSITHHRFAEVREKVMQGKLIEADGIVKSMLSDHQFSYELSDKDSIPPTIDNPEEFLALLVARVALRFEDLKSPEMRRRSYRVFNLQVAVGDAAYFYNFFRKILPRDSEACQQYKLLEKAL